VPVRAASACHHCCQPPSAAVPLDRDINPLRVAVGDGNVMTSQFLSFATQAVKWIGSAQSLLRLTSLTSGQPFLFQAVTSESPEPLGIFLFVGKGAHQAALRGSVPACSAAERHGVLNRERAHSSESPQR
jgi:hypothetical protein